MDRKLPQGLLAVLACAAVLPVAEAEELSFVAVMNGASQVPAVVTPATGIAQVVLDTDALSFRFEVQLFDLSNFTMMHIHHGPPGASGPLIYTLSRDRTVTYVAGEQSLEPVDLEDLLLGNLYVNAHTTGHPDGEIRGQLLRGAIRGRTVSYTAHLSPGNEVPPLEEPDAGAAALLTLDLRLIGNEVVGGFAAFDLDYRFPGSVDWIGFHLHRGVAGENGPVAVNSGLSRVVDTDGRGRMVFRVPATSAAGLQTFRSVLADPGTFYLDVHTAENAGGALRGQLQRGPTRP